MKVYNLSNIRESQRAFSFCGNRYITQKMISGPTTRPVTVASIDNGAIDISKNPGDLLIRMMSEIKGASTDHFIPAEIDILTQKGKTHLRNPEGIECMQLLVEQFSDSSRTSFFPGWMIESLRGIMNGQLLEGMHGFGMINVKNRGLGIVFDATTGTFNCKNLNNLVEAGPIEPFTINHTALFVGERESMEMFPKFAARMIFYQGEDPSDPSLILDSRHLL